MSASLETAAGLESVRIDRESSLPVYTQIAEAMAAVLRSGALPVGSLLPPERLLSEMYGVSRLTLRQAMSLLEDEGLIESHRGRGTFVSNQRLRKRIQEMRGFTEEILARGGKPKSVVLSLKLITPNRRARDFFGLGEGKKVYELCRLRLNGTLPVAFEEAQIPEDLCPWLDRHDFTRISLYRVLEESYGLFLGSCVEEISARQPTATQRKLLKAPGKGAVLVVNRQSFTTTGQAIELTTSVYRGDLYSAVVSSVRVRKHTDPGI